MDAFGGFGGFATLLLAVIAIGAAAGVGFQRGKIGRLRDDVAEERTRADRADTRADRLENELHQCRADLDALSRVVTGEAHWTAIGHQLDDHHTGASTHWKRSETLLEKIAEVVETYRR